jgi:hypothetical protein
LDIKQVKDTNGRHTYLEGGRGGKERKGGCKKKTTGRTNRLYKIYVYLFHFIGVYGERRRYLLFTQARFWGLNIIVIRRGFEIYGPVILK